MSKFSLKLIFSATLALFFTLCTTPFVKISDAAPASWPSSWTIVTENDPNDCNVNNQFRDVKDAFVADDGTYLFFRLSTYGQAGWPPNGGGDPFEHGRYKWFIDTSSPFDGALSGGNIVNFEFLLTLGDEEPPAAHDGLGELNLYNSALTTVNSETGTGTPGQGGPQGVMGDDIGYRIDGNYVDMYVSYSSLGAGVSGLDDVALFWATDQENPNIAQAPNCDRTEGGFIATKGADLSLEKACHTLHPSSTDNLAYTITISNMGPDTAVNIELTDVLPATSPANSLTNPEYRINGGSWTAWDGATPIPLNNLTDGASHTVEIRVDVAADIASVQPNTASVSSEDDPIATNNSDSCTNSIYRISTAIPTLSEWGMIIMSLLIAGSAVWMIRRRQMV